MNIDRMIIDIPAGAEQILRALRDSGHEAYIVGGCVRDSLLGKTPADWDITTAARPEQVKAVFHKTVDTGIKHGTVTVLMKDGKYEVTTFRTDGVYTDHRHPDEVSFSPDLSEDLKRRDFTVNAMAYSEESGVVDLFGGMADMENRVIRAVGDPRSRFGEDALRMMRAVRFSAQLGYEIDGDTADAIKELAPTLSAVSYERIRDELEKLLVSDHPECVRDLSGLGLTAVFLPEFDSMMDTTQNNPHHKYTVGEHTIAALCASERDRIIRLAVLLHDIAKPLMKTTDAEGIDHFRGHPKKSAEMAGEILRRLKEDNRTIARVKNLITWHDLRPESDPVSVRKTAAKVGREDLPLLFDVMYADVMGQSEYLQKEKLTRLSEVRTEWARIEAAGEPVEIRDLAVTGSDLIAAGVEPGPMVGEKLDRLLGRVLEDPSLNTKEELLERL